MSNQINRIYFYIKKNKKIIPSKNQELNKLAKNKLDQIRLNIQENNIPNKYINNWENVSLYHPSGKIEKANSILIDPEEGAYNLKNKLNDLTGKQWVRYSCSWFIFNALAKDLKEERELDQNTQDHPATFSPTMISEFIQFFTKQGDNVFDPFLGIGSTTEACSRTGRVGFGTELNKKYYKLAVKRNPEFKKNIFNHDARKVSELNLPIMDFSISSPPYWDILNRSTKDFSSNRKKSGFDVNYSESELDIGNINDYNKFVDEVCNIYFSVYELLKPGAYIVIIVKNIKKDGKVYPLAWDMAIRLGKKYVLKDEKLWIQDKISLAPYGYPSAWASNILHHYCLILRKE